jgi:mono/diheme cytochrome c family protein
MKIYIRRIVLAVVILILIAVATVYIWSTVIVDKTYAVPLTKIDVPKDTASVREGERLVHIAHCGDCHGEHLTGKVFEDVKPLATLVAPNLTQVIPTYSNEEIERLLRYGVMKNGHSIFIMPAFMYHELKVESISRIIAYLRTLTPMPSRADLPLKSSFTFLGRLLLIRGKLTPIADMIPPDTEGKYVDCDTTPVSFGRYLAMSTCTSCHGPELKGVEGLGPNLIIAASYKKEDFFKLIRTGVALGDRKNIGLMSVVTKNYLRYLNDKEINSIYAYLKTKPTIKNNN